MQLVVLVLSVVGVAALGYRLLRALAGLGLAMAEVSASGQLARLSQERGDLTAMADRRSAERTARQQRRKRAALAAVWLACIIAPPLTPWTQALYAAASPLWFLPYTPVRIRR